MEPESEILFEARRFRVVRRSRRMADGRVHQHEVIEHPGSVVILPMVAPDRVCLIENFRIAVGQTLLELPAGTIENEDDPAETARRELIEETGYRAGKWEKLADFFVSPGILRERMHLYLASEIQAGPTALESGEEIQSKVVSWEEAMRLVDDGKVQDAKTLIGLLLYDRLRRQRVA